MGIRTDETKPKLFIFLSYRGAMDTGVEAMALLLAETKRVFVMDNIIEKLKEFMEQEARSCSMDFGCVTPLYAYRMLGGQYSIVDIECGLREIKRQGAFGL